MAKTSKTTLSKDLAVSPKNRRADFVRLAEGRSYNAIKAIQLIGNLSNTSDYEYTLADVTQIMETIRQELTAAEARFKVALQKEGRRPVKLAA